MSETQSTIQIVYIRTGYTDAQKRASKKYYESHKQEVIARVKERYHQHREELNNKAKARYWLKKKSLSSPQTEETPVESV